MHQFAHVAYFPHFCTLVTHLHNFAHFTHLYTFFNILHIFAHFAHLLTVLHNFVNFAYFVTFLHILHDFARFAQFCIYAKICTFCTRLRILHLYFVQLAHPPAFGSFLPRTIQRWVFFPRTIHR